MAKLFTRLDELGLQKVFEKMKAMASKRDLETVKDSVKSLAPVARTGSYNDLTDNPDFATNLEIDNLFNGGI